MVALCLGSREWTDTDYEPHTNVSVPMPTAKWAALRVAGSMASIRQVHSCTKQAMTRWVKRRHLLTLPYLLTPVKKYGPNERTDQRSRKNTTK